MIFGEGFLNSLQGHPRQQVGITSLHPLTLGNLDTTGYCLPYCAFTIHVSP